MTIDRVYEVHIYEHKGPTVALYTSMWKDKESAIESAKEEVRLLKENGFLDAEYSVVEHELN